MVEGGGVNISSCWSLITALVRESESVERAECLHDTVTFSRLLRPDLRLVLLLRRYAPF